MACHDDDTEYMITYVHCAQSQMRLVDADKYGFIEMLYDIYNSVLRFVPDGRTLRFSVRCVYPNQEGELELRSDNDVMSLFRRHASAREIRLDVYNVDFSHYPTEVYTINGYPSSMIRRDDQSGRQWVKEVRPVNPPATVEQEDVGLRRPPCRRRKKQHVSMRGRGRGTTTGTPPKPTRTSNYDIGDRPIDSSVLESGSLGDNTRHDNIVIGSQSASNVIPGVEGGSIASSKCQVRIVGTSSTSRMSVVCQSKAVGGNATAQSKSGAKVDTYPGTSPPRAPVATPPTAPPTSALKGPVATPPTASPTSAPKGPVATPPTAPPTSAPRAPDIRLPTAPSTSAPRAPDISLPTAPSTSAPRYRAGTSAATEGTSAPFVGSSVNFTRLSDEEEWRDSGADDVSDSSDSDFYASEAEAHDASEEAHDASVEAHDELSDYDPEEPHEDYRREGPSLSQDGKLAVGVGMVFPDIHCFRAHLKDYAIQEGFELLYRRNENKRVTVCCGVNGCSWRVHASPTTLDKVTFKVKTYNPTHSCQKNPMNKTATSSWIAQKMAPILKEDPNMSVESMKAYLMKTFGLKSEYMKVYREKMKAKEMHEGSHSKSYGKLIRYGELLQEKNPGSIYKMQFEQCGDPQRPLRFKRVFICFDACKKGFLKGCRPFLGLDGTHLKGKYGGVLLSAIALDGNSGLFPVAFSVVEVECKDSWMFFLHNLYAAILPLTEDNALTFMSDKQKGLTDAISQIFPHSHHRHCCRHLYNNLKQFNSSDLVKDLFWEAARAPTLFYFNRAMSKILAHDKDVHDWILKTSPSMWSRHAFDHTAKSEHNTNNMSESFNQWINPARCMPILTLLDDIRVRLMGRLQQRYETSLQLRGTVTPIMKRRLDQIQTASRQCTVVPAGNNKFEVSDIYNRFVVNLGDRTCDCNVWMQCGLPCLHAAAAILFKRGNLEEFCHPYLSVQTYIAAYEEMIHPMPDLSMIEPVDGNDDELQPPPMKRLPGRPHKNRRREPGEARSGEFRKRASSVRCDNCKGIGHNRRTCQGAPVASNKRTRTQPSQDTVGTSQRQTRSQTSSSNQPLTAQERNRVRMARMAAKQRARAAMKRAVGQ